MIDINVDNTYEYKDYYIVDDLKSGLWVVLDSDSNTIGQFSTSDEAEDYINSYLIDNYSSIYNINTSDNNLPIKTYTNRRIIRTKYKNCIGRAFVLYSEYSNNKYKCKDKNRIYIGNFNDDNLLVFKSVESAYHSRRYSKSNYSIIEVRLNNGNVELI